MMLEPGKVLGERYEIAHKIGAGGMSIVYLAKCNKLQRFVAIKVLRDEFARDEDFVQKFRAEAFSAGSLSHPNIVGIYDVGSEGDLHYIVMEYVEGETLKDYIDKHGALSTKEVLELGIQIVSAIKHAHKKQIIHRDIKPQNIIVSHDNVLKVADFGIARAVDSSTIVATCNAIGSVHYFSPEQAKGKYVNETSDLYSCGIVLFELVTNRLPFQADSHVSIALKHINEEIPRPSSINSQVAIGLEQIILKATHKQQEFRYQNADAMLDDMRKVLEDPFVILENIADDSIDQTILLTEEQTNYIRQNDKQMKSVDQDAVKGGKLDMPEDFFDEENEEGEEEVSPLYKWLVTLGAVFATLVVMGMIVFGVFFLWPSWNEPKYVDVPNVVGQTVEEATSLAQKEKLALKVSDYEITDEVEAGTIIRQTPLKEQVVEPGTEIQVVVAKADEVVEVTVTDMIGIDGAEAQRILDKQGLISKIDRAYSDTLELGKVIDQEPSAGTVLEAGEAVKLIISKGPKEVMAKVPNLYNLTEDAAKLSLSNANLKLGKVTQKAHDTMPIGVVMEQSISANTDATEGTAIDIVVSSGPEVPVVPEVPEEVVPEQPEVAPEQPAEVSKTHIIREPDNTNKDEYHVLVMLESENGSVVVFDDMVKQEQLPLPVTVFGTGQGTLITYFDSQEEFRDKIVFNEVTQ